MLGLFYISYMQADYTEEKLNKGDVPPYDIFFYKVKPIYLVSLVAA